jgi:hypothetical protein
MTKRGAVSSIIRFMPRILRSFTEITDLLEQPSLARKGTCRARSPKGSGKRPKGLSDCVLLDWKRREAEFRRGEPWQLKLVTE